MLILGNRPHSTSDEFALMPRTVHLVTPEMTKGTDAQAKKVAPAFALKDSDGQEVAVGAPNGERPQFVYFVLEGCPCSVDAEPLFHKLYERYKGKVDFVSITNADEEKARRWSVQMLTPYPVIPDPKHEVIKAYEAKSSVYAALVTKDGRIAKMWPGYSQDILADQNALLAKLAGVKVEPFDAQYAPTNTLTGCSF